MLNKCFHRQFSGDQQNAAFCFVSMSNLFCCFLSMALVFVPKVIFIRKHAHDPREKEEDEKNKREEEKRYKEVVKENEMLQKKVQEVRLCKSFQLSSSFARIGQEELVSCSSDYSTRWLAMK
jgi:flagellar biosynthesis component FlhA